MGRVVTGSIVAMTAYTATLDSGEVFRFDNAVICTGTTYINTAMPWPNTNCAITKQERLEELLVRCSQLTYCVRHMIYRIPVTESGVQPRNWTTQQPENPRVYQPAA